MALSHTLYDTMPGSPISLLFEDYIVGTSTGITLDDGSIAPDAPNIITVMSADKTRFATIHYSVKEENVLTGLTVIRGDGLVFEAGTDFAVRNYTYEDDTAVKGNITDVEERVVSLEESSLSGVSGVKINGTELQKDAENKVNIPVGGSSLGVVKSGNEAIVSADGSIDISTATTRIESAIDAVSDDLEEHLNDMENPHNVTKADVGLPNVEDGAQVNVQSDWNATTGDSFIKNKPTAVSAFTNDADYQNGTQVSSTVSGAIGTHNSSTAAHQDIRGDIADVVSGLEGKVDKETGKGLSTNDFTTAYKNKVDNTKTSLDTHVADKTNPHEVSASQIGVEEGAEVNVIEGVQLNGNDVTLTGKKANIPPATTSSLGVVKVGTNLSISADGTLSATGGELTQLQSDWTQTDTTQPDFIKNKPTLGTAAAKNTGTGTDNVILGNDSRLTDAREPTAHASTHISTDDRIPDATASAPGLMSATDKVKLNGIAAGAEVNVNADWDATSGDAQILNKPTAVSEFSNDAEYQTSTQVTSAISTHNTSESAHADIRGLISSEVSRAEGEEQSLQEQIDGLASRSDVVDVVGTKAELLAYDTSALANNDIVKVLVDESQSNAISYYRWVITAGTGAWNYVGSQGPFYTKSETDGYFVPQQRTVNGKSLANNVTLGASDVNALPDTTTLADLDDDSTHRVVTDTQISSWNAKQGALTFDNTPTEDSANPVKSGGVFSALSGKAEASALTSHTSNTSNPHSVTKAQVGLGNVDNTSDADKQISTATATALAGKVDIVEGKGLSSNDYTTAEKSKLAGIAAGAQVNVQADWNATTEATGQIKNKPTLGTAAAKNTGTGTGDVILGNDSRLTNKRDPNLHASSHFAGADDEITPADIGAEPAFAKNTAFNKAFGTAAGTVCQGNDSRLSNKREPTDHASTHAAGGSDEITPASIGAEPTITKKTAFNVDFDTGTHAANTVVAGNDSRLSAVATTTANGLMSSADKTKLDGIAAGAEVNVQSDWTASSGDAFIKNKPSLGTASAKDVPATGDASASQVVLGSDSRLTNQRTPTAHASSHATGGTDAITPSSIGAEPAIGTKGTAFNASFGTGHSNVPYGDDSRFMTNAERVKLAGIQDGAEVNVQSDWNATAGDSLILNKPTAMTPTAHVSTHKPNGTDALYSTATATLTTSGWSSKSQTVSVSGVTTSNTVIVAPAPASIDVWSTAGCKCSAQGSGTLTFTCEEVPTASITVNVMVML